MNRMHMHHPSPSNRRCRRRGTMPHRRGVALLLVLGVVVMASVLGYAMLSSAAMQKQASSNAAVTAGAQAMAESGLNLAVYYLQNPQKSPSYPTAYPASAAYSRSGGYWTGTNGQFLDFGSPAIGAAKVTVTRKSDANLWQYEVESIGRSPGSALERKVQATVFVNADYRVEYAAMFTNDASLPGNVRIGQSGQNNGDVYSNSGIAIRSGGYVRGRGYRRKTLASSVAPEQSWATPVHDRIVPTFTEVRSYLTYEFPKGTVRNATVLTGVTKIGQGQTYSRLEPTPSNPAGVYYVPGSVTLGHGTEILGTLIVNGSASVTASLLGGTVKLRQAESGFPALVVKDNLTFGSLLSVAPYARVEGLTYVGGRIDGSGLLPTLEVRGALLVNGTSPTFLSLPLSTLEVNYDPDLARVPDFSEVGRTPMNVRMLDWEAQ